jgi:hypothetical protein
VLLAALLLLQCGDIETNPGPRKSVSKAPSAEDKINGLASTLSDYEAKIQGKAFVKFGPMVFIQMIHTIIYYRLYWSV